MSIQRLAPLQGRWSTLNSRRAAASVLAALVTATMATPAQAAMPLPLEGNDTAAFIEESSDNELAEGNDTSEESEVADSGEESVENADLPDSGDYTCIKPGKHELALRENGSMQMVLNDFTGPSVVARDDLSVVVPVPDAAMRQVSADDVAAGFGQIAPQGKPVWTLPMSENPALARLSFDTTGWDWRNVNQDGLKIALGSQTGPGPIALWNLNEDKNVALQAHSEKKELALSVHKAGVTPINTSFVAPGNYEVDVIYRANGAGRLPSTQYTIYFAVGDKAVRQACGDAFIPVVKDNGSDDGAAGQPPAAGHNSSTAGQNSSAAGQDSPAAGQNSSAAGQDSPAADQTPPAAGQTPPSNTTPHDAGKGNGPHTSQPADTPQSNTQQHNPGKDKTHATEQPDSAGKKQTDPAGPQSGQNPAKDKQTHTGASGSQILDTAAAGAANLNILDKQGKQTKRLERQRQQRAAEEQARNASAASEICRAVAITRESEAHEADKVRQAQAEQGTARTTLTFNVGDGAQGNVTEGHFDLGPIIDNNTIYARVKDDRSQPAQWIDPSSVSFALGSAAALKVPAGMDNIAPAGKTVWMIQQSQRPNVPWVGMNSQHPSVLKETTGPVTFTLEAVNGPGKVAVFESGAFGSGIGALVFNGAGSSYTIGANTHSHHNWVFTEPGTYTLTLTMSVEGKNGVINGSGSIGGFTVTGEVGPNGRPIIQEIVGRTESGAECDLSAAVGGASGLAKTGAEALHFLVLAVAASFLGAYLMTVGKQNA